MVARKTARKVKVKPTFSRRAQTGFAAAPQDNFRDFNDYVRTEVDKKDVISKIKSYIRKSVPKADARIAMDAPEWSFAGLPLLASTIVWKEMDKEFPAWWDADKVLKKHVKELLARGRAKQAEKANKPEEAGLVKKTIQEIIQERTSEFIGGIDNIVDNWETAGDYSVYDELKKIDAPYNMAKTAFAYYTPQVNEINELVNDKPEDLLEAYSSWSTSRRKKYLKFLTELCAEIEKYMASKKALRATRKPKVKTADKQVEKLNYAKESKEYKLTSITPTSIIGAMRLYTFNTKYRELTEYVCQKAIGFEVKGTTILGLDADLCRSTRLRKPDEFIPAILSKSSTQINKEWSKLTTKISKNVNGRINKDVIILRALAK
tara:strand:+ start:13258 stop:14385 length:1128 start_codon:yes stop_codon:yes gene_type:complete